MFVVIGYADHGYEGYGAPRYCSRVFDCQDDAEDFIKKYADKVSPDGCEMLYTVLETGENYRDDITW